LVHNIEVLVKIFTPFGVALLIAASYFYIRAVQYGRLNLQPLSLPVSLAPRAIRTPEFKTDFEYWDYEIAVDWDAKRGTLWTNPMLIDVSWQLFEGANIAAEGNSRQVGGGVVEESGFYERRIGSFRAQKGHQYSLVLHVNHGGTDQNGTHPRIVVQIPKLYWEGHAMGVGFQKLFAGVSAIFGLAALIGAYALWKSRQRSTNEAGCRSLRV
jgi:hypothetical protein